VDLALSYDNTSRRSRSGARGALRQFKADLTPKTLNFEPHACTDSNNGEQN
jgi:hypothetical protein